MKPRIAFFGTPHYSLLVLEPLFQAGFPIVCVVTKPPRPVGRKQEMTPTPVSLWAETNKIPVLTPTSHSEKPWLFADENQVTQEVLKFKPDILISADYTQKIPTSLLTQTPLGGLNVHPSLLPAYRGPAPIPWALVNGETETGVSIITLTDKLDEGTVVAQEKETIQSTDTTDSLLTKLFTKGGEMLVTLLPHYTPNQQPTTNNLQPSYFPRLTRDHGFEPWAKIQAAMEVGTEAERIERKYRAFHPWPGLWTKVKLRTQNSELRTDEKRLKILKCHLQLTTDNSQPLLVLDEIQLEGKESVTDKNVGDLLRKLQ